MVSVPIFNLAQLLHGKFQANLSAEAHDTLQLRLVTERLELSSPVWSTKGSVSLHDSGVVQNMQCASPTLPACQCCMPSGPPCARAAVIRWRCSSGTGASSKCKMPAMALIVDRRSRLQSAEAAS